MIDEMYEYYPGIAVLDMGYIPIGSCMEGSGDPYFVKLNQNPENSNVVRIRHDLVEDDDTYLESNIEIVSNDLTDFFSNCSVI
ncbi:hypothetical protein A9Q98_14320 [Thalassotalea sp. 42_200_T64]|nr:hypothetical protein A9Q98_14320 [Thalassotalea sp. 42_200_T64]